MRFLKKLAAEYGYQYDPQTASVYGKKNGYTFLLLLQGQKQYQLIFSVKKATGAMEPVETETIKQSSNAISSLQSKNYKLVCVVKSGLTLKR